MTDAVYTEQVILELIDKTGAALDAVTARFKTQAAEIQAIATESGASFTEGMAERAADTNLFWDLYVRRVKMAAAEEKEIARELWTFRKEGIAEVAAADARAKAEELMVAKELHRYRMEAAAEEKAAAAGGGSGAAGGLARGLGAPGGGAATVAGLVAGFTLVHEIEEAEKFDKALHDMGTLLADASMPAAQFNELLKETGHMATEVSERFNLDLLGVIKGYKEALSSGWSADELKDMGEAAGTMARAIHSTFDQAASMMSTYRQAQHLTAKQTEAEAGDMIFNLINIAKKLDVSEFEHGMGRILGVAHAAGLGFKDVGAGLTVLTNQGMTTSQAITSLANTILRMSTMSGKVKAEFEDMAKAAGLGADAFNTHANSYTQLMENVKKATGGSEELIKKLFPERFMLKGVLAATESLGALGSAFTAMGDSGTAAVAKMRSMDNAFDNVESRWKGITNSIKEALVVSAEFWVGGRDQKTRPEDSAERNYARYGNLYASDKTMQQHEQDRDVGRADNSPILDKEFQRRIQFEDGFAARVKIVGDYQTKLAFDAKAVAEQTERAAQAAEKLKEDAQETAKAAAEEYETRKATEKLMTKMEKPGKGDALHFAGGALAGAAQGILSHFGLPDLQQIEDSVRHMEKAGKQIAKDQKEIEREVSNELIKELDARERELQKFNDKKLADIKSAKEKEAAIDREMANLETRLNEEIFETKMKQKGGGGKHVDADAQARFARGQLEEIEQKLRDASGPRSKVGESDFKNLISEYEKISRAKEGAMDKAGNGDRGVRQRLDEESTEQGFIGAFRKMSRDSSNAQVDGINGRVFKGKSNAELAKEAAKKVEEKHITEVKAEVNLNIVGIVKDDLQTLIKSTVTKVISDISNRGTGVTGRPSLSRDTVITPNGTVTTSE